jgi:hypothetical protein
MLIIPSNLSKRRLSGREEENTSSRSYIATVRVYLFGKLFEERRNVRSSWIVLAVMA